MDVVLYGDRGEGGAGDTGAGFGDTFLAHFSLVVLCCKDMC